MRSPEEFAENWFSRPDYIRDDPHSLAFWVESLLREHELIIRKDEQDRVLARLECVVRGQSGVRSSR